MKKIFKQIQKINKFEKVGVPEALCKLAEEFGELAQVINKTIGRKPHTLTEEQIQDNIIEECADVIQNVLCIADKRGVPYKKIKKAMKRKNKKWKAVIKKR